MRRPGPIALLMPLALLAATLGGVALADPGLSPTAVEARGRQTATLTVERFGRYTVQVKSEQGVALQLVDRMEGPGPLKGVVGEADGRVDAFLDRGNYRIVAVGAEAGAGEATLTAVASAELNTTPVRLIPDRPLITTLGDLQHRSWWLDLEADQVVALEAVGRHLADLRIWRDGSWLVDAQTRCETIEPITGQPLQRCTLVRRLNKGLYRLGAYGGAGDPWAVAGDDTGLHVSWGVPRLGGDAGRETRTIGPFGVDRVRLDGAARTVSVSLAEVKPTELVVSPYSVNDPFRASGDRASITKESRIPVARVRAALNKENVVTVVGAPGEPYVLEWFPPAGTRHVLGGQGEYYLTTIHGGAAGDRPDTTALLMRGTGDAQMIEDQQSVALSSKHRYERRFNLTGLTTLHLDVRQTGDFVIEAEGAEVRVMPVVDELPEGVRMPDFAHDGLEAGLPTGPHELQLRPKGDGGVTVVTLKIRPAMWNPLVGGLSLPERVELPPVIQRGRISLNHANPLTLYRNSQGEAPVGVVLRALPTNLSAPVPFTLGPGGEVEVEVQAPGRGTVQAVDHLGQPLQVSIDRGPWSDGQSVGQSTFEVRVRNDRDTVVAGSIRIALETRPPSTVALPDARLEQLPRFPRLTAQKPAFTDLDRAADRTWTVRVDAPSLYILESTGLLHTAGNLRTRTRLGFAKADGNGVGRNFRVARYLGEGDYQLTVATRGNTRGRLGVQLVNTPLIDGGAIRPGVPARRTVPAGRGIAYTFTIEEAGRYRLRSFGRGHTFDCRLEDAEGWPVTDPVTRCDMTRRLEAGGYRVIVLPSAVETQRLTRIEPVRQAVSFEGHGPHALPMNSQVRHVWREPTGGGPRTPDWWDFHWPAEGGAKVSLPADMTAELLRKAGDDLARVQRISGGRDQQIELPAGSYRLAVRAARRNDHLPYTLKIVPDQLMAGHRWMAKPEDRIEVAVGEARLYRFASDGGLDLRARLLDSEGRVLAANDDRPDGWNFRIATRLTPGRYTLEIDTLDRAHGRTEVRMDAPETVDGEALRIGEIRSLVPDGATHHLPLSLPQGAAVALVSARSTQNAGLAIEVEGPDGWVTLAEGAGPGIRLAAMPLDQAPLRVRVWSLDVRGLPVEVIAHAPPAPAIAEAALARGRALKAVGGAPAGVVALRNAPAGVFTVSGPDDLMVCLGPGRGCVRADERPVAVGEAGLVLIGTGRAIARRQRLSATPLLMTLPAGRSSRVDLSAGDGPVWIEARSPIGQPSLALGDGPMALGGAAAGALDLSGAATSVAARSGDEGAVDTRLRAVRLSRPGSETVAGVTEGPLAAGESRALEPVDGASSRVTLAAGLVALADDALVWAADGPLEAELPPAKRVVVLNPSPEPARFRLAVQRNAAPPAPLTAMRPIERALVRAGVQRIMVDPVEGARIRLTGAIESARLVEPSGAIDRADGAAADRGGVLWIHHRPGPLLAWLERDGGASPWQTKDGPSKAIRADQIVPLSGPLQALTVEAGQPVMVHVRLAAPHVSRAIIAGADERVALRPAGGGVDLWLPEGKADIRLRGVAGAPLWGAAEVSFSTPVDIGEGVGPEVLLAPGAATPFSFTLEREGSIGIGVRAEADRVEATLLDATGEVVAEGPVQMPTLAAGTWLLVLRLPPDAAPVQVRPALAGVEPPDGRPPEEVIRRYLELAGRAPASD